MNIEKSIKPSNAYSNNTLLSKTSTSASQHNVQQSDKYFYDNYKFHRNTIQFLLLNDREILTKQIELLPSFTNINDLAKTTKILPAFKMHHCRQLDNFLTTIVCLYLTKNCLCHKKFTSHTHMY